MKRQNKFSLPGIVILFLLLTACTSTPAVSPAQSSSGAPANSGSQVPEASGAVAPGSSAGAESGALRFEIVADQSQASYRIREQLAELSLPSDAVGVTHGVSGNITINPDGSIVSSESRFQVDLTQLTSDRSMRDNFVRRNILRTSQFPSAVFVPAQVTGLPSPLPQSGPVSFTLAGNLTIMDVTRPVEWQVTGTLEGGELTGQATTSFTFSDFNLSQPRVRSVLSLEDTIKLELDFVMKPAGG